MDTLKNTWKIGNKIYFYFGNKKYVGEISDRDMRNGKYKVKFPVGVHDNTVVYSEEWLDETEIKAYRTRLNTFLFPYDLAEFVTEKHGVKLGVVFDFETRKGEEYFDFNYYNVTSNNKIELVTNKNVHRSRVTYISASENEFKILPVRKGSKVEFNSTFEKKRVKGTIVEITGFYDLPFFSIRYTRKNTFGEKETEIEDDISLEDIFIVK